MNGSKRTSYDICWENRSKSEPKIGLEYTFLIHAKGANDGWIKQ